MNAVDILKYGQLTVLGCLEGLSDAAWEEPGVCGVWSVRNIVAHLASYEQLLVEVLGTFLGDGATPTLDCYLAQGPAFNDIEVAKRQGLSASETLAEFHDAHARTMELIEGVPEATRRTPGTLPWYGMEYALDDLLVYAYYGHKREHSAQVAVFRDRLAARTAAPQAATA